MSPYNLWSVRFVRWVTVLLAVVTFLWWVAILVSPFATPPGFHSRGSGFFTFSYASVALFTLLVTLLFFAVPSRSVRVIALVTAVRVYQQIRLALCVCADPLAGVAVRGHDHHRGC